MSTPSTTGTAAAATAAAATPDFESGIRRWVHADNQLKELNRQVKALREERNELEEQLIQVAQQRQMTHSTISISDGRLKFVETTVQEPLSYRFLQETLSEIIPNADQVRQIMDYIRQKRGSRRVPEIKRFFHSDDH